MCTISNNKSVLLALLDVPRQPDRLDHLPRLRYHLRLDVRLELVQGVPLRAHPLVLDVVELLD